MTVQTEKVEKEAEPTFREEIQMSEKEIIIPISNRRSQQELKAIYVE